VKAPGKKEKPKESTGPVRVGHGGGEEATSVLGKGKILQKHIFKKKKEGGKGKKIERKNWGEEKGNGAMGQKHERPGKKKNRRLGSVQLFE